VNGCACDRRSGPTAPGAITSRRWTSTSHVRRGLRPSWQRGPKADCAECWKLPSVLALAGALAGPWGISRDGTWTPTCVVGELARSWFVQPKLGPRVRCRDMASDCVIDNEIGFQAHLALGYIETERSIRFKKPLVSAGEG
jgi:hypothetical protein